MHNRTGSPGFYCTDLESAVNSIEAMAMYYLSHGIVRYRSELWLVANTWSLGQFMVGIAREYGLLTEGQEIVVDENAHVGDFHGIKLWTAAHLPEGAFFVVPEYQMPEFVKYCYWKRYTERKTP